ncbi:uncharacterized protein L3040_002230 [Drepanopeziza brunnea f. sp. 'multigermtubi']|nr:hypothetical protein L3040_002230 [Drepanopeziza brunnea f. sp. 'multigermtubi']
MPSNSPRALFRRQAAADSCEIPEISDTYDTALHVGALFIILGVSFSACLVPIVAVRIPRLRIPPNFLFVVRHFGTGVLVATALVHLLPEAFGSLTDPCLPSFWNTTYPALPGALSMGAIFMIIAVQMVLSPGQNCCAMPTAIIESNGVNNAGDSPSGGGACMNRNRSEPGAIHGRDGSTGRQLQMVTAYSENLDALERLQHYQKNEATTGVLARTETASPEQKRKKDTMQCVLLEMGILFHSVFIGMALSVATGSDFIVLLIAISFHQTFEGLALGSRIAVLSWGPGAWQPWLMALAYGCTTPVGQAIGIATHSLYSPESTTGLLLVGIMNAISGGLLLWASLAELLMEDFLSDESWRILNGWKRVIACLLVLLGAFGMSLIGAWA